MKQLQEVIYKLYGSNNFKVEKSLLSTDNSTITKLNNGCILKVLYNKDAYEKEVAILQDLKNCNCIINLKQFWNEVNTFDNNFNSFKIMLPYYEDGDLFTFIKSNQILNLMDIKNIFSKLLIPVKYCHDKNIIHIDLKLENFLIKKNIDNSIKDIILIDFGMSYKFNSKNINDNYVYLEKCYGTPEYINPELKKKIYGKFTDIWCLGVILYIMLFKKYPNSNYNYFINNNCDEDTQVFINKLLQINYKTRPSIDDIIKDIWLYN